MFFVLDLTSPLLAAFTFACTRFAEPELFPQTLLHHPEDTKEATNTISASGLEAQLSSGTFGGGNQTVWVKS